MKENDIFEKTKDTGGFRPIGAKIKILEVGKDLIKAQHLFERDGGLLGDETVYYGRDFLEENYKFHAKIL